MAYALVGLASAAQAQDRDLTKLSLEDLLSAEITSVAKKPQRVDEAAAAIFVVSQEDIRRSAALDIPDILRMVPGMEVGQLPSGGAAVSARGFNGLSANKLLVLVDGREIYISDLGGVFWDQQLLPVEDIQRIEIVRGPGATLWGANAVNGVINIVSKHSVDTLGAAATAEVDSQGADRFYARFGAQIGASTTVRAYLTDHSLRDRVEGPSGQSKDFATGIQGGFRLDSEPSEKDALTLQGDVQAGHNGLDPILPNSGPRQVQTYSGNNLVGRWSRSFDDRSGFTLQAYWDHIHRSESGLDDSTDQIDLDVSDHFDLTPRNAIIWGAGVRRVSDRVTGSTALFLSPERALDVWYGTFIENDITLVPDRLNISIGAKFEHSADSGFQFQPSIRAIWRSPGGWSVWAAASRATRTPSRFEGDLTALTPALLLSPGSLTSESMVAYEIGWRGQLHPAVVLDVAAYHQVYDRLISWGLVGITPAGLPNVQNGNNGHGRSTGVEAALDLTVNSRWTIKVAGDLLSLRIAPGGINSVNSANSIDETASPHTQASVRSLWNVSNTVDLDIWYRRVGKLNGGAVPAYNDLDVHLAWRPTAHLEMTLAGQNLLSQRRIEFSDLGLRLSTFVARRAMVKLAVKY